MEKETISMEWKDSGDISNADLLPKVGLLEPDYHCTSRSMFGDITTGIIQKELRYGESSNYWKRVRGGNGTLPFLFNWAVTEIYVRTYAVDRKILSQ